MEKEKAFKELLNYLTEEKMFQSYAKFYCRKDRNNECYLQIEQDRVWICRKIFEVLGNVYGVTEEEAMLFLNEEINLFFNGYFRIIKFTEKIAIIKGRVKYL